MRAITMMLLAASLIVLAASGCSRHQDRNSTQTMSSPHGRDVAAYGRSPHGGSGKQGVEVEDIVPEVKRLVERTVKDPSRARQVETVIEDLVREVKRANQETRGFHEQLTVLNADYEAKREQFQQVVKELAETRAERADKILDMRFKARDLMTAQEWKELNDKLFKYRREAEGYGS